MTTERLMRHSKRTIAAMLIDAQAQLDYCRQQLADSRADERQAMTYLEQCRQAVGHDGDFPSLVERLGNPTRR
jgi:hypothetical protein